MTAVLVVGAHGGSGKTYGLWILTAGARVQLGAAWLDATHPGWRDRVDVDRLDMGDSCGCVLGQALQAVDPAAFYAAVEAAAPAASGVEAYPGERWAIAHGFDSGYGLTGGGNAALRAEWARVLQAGTAPQEVSR